ncbi:hypothetical protein K7432_016097 [Basidiobolus ranarum]|uniref:Uncharacterized protein n=1 Tax=Basidiobolus ranarum TaxID=34480 RepID=A0ABR2VM53_9FUNG
MFANVPSGDLNNFGYVGQPPLYPNNIIPPFVNVPIPNNVNLDNSPLLFNGFPTSMDVEEWNTYMDQNMLSTQINSMDYINMQSGWSPSTGV